MCFVTLAFECLFGGHIPTIAVRKFGDDRDVKRRSFFYLEAERNEQLRRD